jgi:Outer membrane protein and related peptidoglycan-associated (lipo)proteins
VLSYRWTGADSARNSGNANGVQGGAGIHFLHYFEAELDGQYSGFGRHGGGPDWQEFGGELNFHYVPFPEWRVAPFLSAGGGWVRTEQTAFPPPAGSSNDLYWTAGLGLIGSFKAGKLPMQLRVEARYRHLHVRQSVPNLLLGGNNLNEPIVTVGLALPFAWPHPKKAAPPPPPPPAPPPQKAEAKPKPAAKVECARKFESVHFAFNKDQLTAYARVSLNGTAKTVQTLEPDCTGLKVQVSGNTDWIGSDNYNQALSERRANVVRQYLIRKGIEGARIESFAYGETRPVAPNTTAEGRALNRRTDIETLMPKP